MFRFTEVYVGKVRTSCFVSAHKVFMCFNWLTVGAADLSDVTRILNCFCWFSWGTCLRAGCIFYKIDIILQTAHERQFTPSVLSDTVVFLSFRPWRALCRLTPLLLWLSPTILTSDFLDSDFQFVLSCLWSSGLQGWGGGHEAVTCCEYWE